MNEQIMTVDELSTYLHVHRSTIYRLLKQKILPAFKVGSKDWRFTKDQIDKWRFAQQDQHGNSKGIG